MLALLTPAADGATIFLELPSPFGADDELRGIDFVNAKEGWIVGGDQETEHMSPAEQRIYHTTDGGQTWTQQLPVEEYGVLNSVFALDANNVYAGGNFFFDFYDARATSNGGTTWLG